MFLQYGTTIKYSPGTFKIECTYEIDLYAMEMVPFGKLLHQISHLKIKTVYMCRP